MEEWVQSDLACEAGGGGNEAIPGVLHREECVGEIRIRRTHIETEEASRRLQQACGSYTGFLVGILSLLSPSTEKTLCALLSGEVRGMAERLCGKRLDRERSVLVVGLGNAGLTPDAIGPRTLSRLVATRHLAQEQAELYRELDTCALSLLAPGVLGQTGIETLELLRGAVRAVKPDLLVAVDALAARDCAHLSSVIQVSDSGLRPGSGVGNRRAAVDRETLGVPVIAIGVPTVVRSSILVLDALHEAGVGEVGEEVRRVLENRRDFFVTSKDCDAVTDAAARLLAEALAEAFTPGLVEAGLV